MKTKLQIEQKIIDLQNRIKELHDEFSDVQQIESEYGSIIDQLEAQIDILNWIIQEDTINSLGLTYFLSCLHCPVCEYFDNKTRLCTNQNLIALCTNTPIDSHYKLINGEWCSGFKERM